MSVCGKHLQRVLSSVPLLILFASNLSAQKITLAVVDLEGIGISQTEAVALSNRLRNELFRLGAFKVVDRGMMKEILDEQTLQLSGCTSNECLVEVGRLLGVQQMVGGSISKIGTLFSVSTWLVDVETGEVLNVSDYDIDGGLEDVLRGGMKEVAETLSKTMAQSGTEPIENISKSGNDLPVFEIIETKPEVNQRQPSLTQARKSSHLEVHAYGGLGVTINIAYRFGIPNGIKNRYQVGLQIGIASGSDDVYKTIYDVQGDVKRLVDNTFLDDINKFQKSWETGEGEYWISTVDSSWVLDGYRWGGPSYIEDFDFKIAYALIVLNRSYGWEQGWGGLRVLSGIGISSISAHLSHYNAVYIDEGFINEAHDDINKNSTGVAFTIGVESRLGNPRFSLILGYHLVYNPFQGLHNYPQIGILLPI